MNQSTELTLSELSAFADTLNQSTGENTSVARFFAALASNRAMLDLMGLADETQEKE